MGKLTYCVIVWMSLLTSIVVALPIQVTPIINEQLQAFKTFNYTFNFTTDDNCSNVVFSNYTTITTNVTGSYTVDLNISGISTIPSYLCEYRDGILRKVHIIPDQVFRDVYGRNANFTQNVSADWFKGKINYSDIQNNPSFVYSSNLSNLTVNKSDYWDDLNTTNSTQIQNNGGVLNIMVGWLRSLFYIKTEVYNQSETDVNLSLRLLVTDQSYNETGVITSSNSSWITTYNATYAGLINNISYLSTYNSTYDSYITSNQSNNSLYLNGTSPEGFCRLNVPNTGNINLTGNINMSGAIRFPTTGTTKTYLYNDLAESGNGTTDGFRILYNDDYAGSGLDYIVFEKTDSATSVDGGFAFKSKSSTGEDFQMLRMTSKNAVIIGNSTTDGSMGSGDLYVEGDIQYNGSLYLGNPLSSTTHYIYGNIKGIYSIDDSDDTFYYMSNMFMPSWGLEGTSSNANFFGSNQDELFNIIKKGWSWNLTRGDGVTSGYSPDLFSHSPGEWVTLTSNYTLTIENDTLQEIPVRSSDVYWLVISFRGSAYRPNNITVSVKNESGAWNFSFNIIPNASESRSTYIDYMTPSGTGLYGIKIELGNPLVASTYLDDVYLLHGTAPILEFLRADGGDLYGDLRIYNETGSLNVQINKNGTAYFDQNITARGYNTMTSVYDKTRGTALSWIKDSSELTTNGRIQHNQFYGYKTIKIDDMKKPIYKSICGPITTGYVNDTPIEENICRDEITGYQQKEVEVVDLVEEIAMLEQSLVEIKDCTKDSKTWEEYQICILKE